MNEQHLTDRQREAVLRVLAGEPIAIVARGLGVSRRQIDRALRVANRLVAATQQPAAVKDHDPERRCCADRLLADLGFLQVWYTAQHDPEYDDPGYTISVRYTDVAAVVFDDLVVQSLLIIERVLGVDSVMLEDRGFIRVAGSAQPPLIRETLIRWWSEQLQRIAATG